MKKLMILCAVIAFSALLLCSCLLFGPGENTPPEDNTVALTPQQEKLKSVMNGSTDLDSLSLNELLELYDTFLEDDGVIDALNDGAEYDLLYRDVELKVNSADAEIDFTHPENAQTAVFSDEKWVEKDYEALDPTANMSPRDKASYEAALSELEDFDVKEFQAGIDELLLGMEGFEDYEPPEIGSGDSQMLNEWPDNELTRQVPRPDFKDPMIVADSESVTLMAMNSSLDEAKAYASRLRAAGFTRDVNENTQSIAGYTIYSFYAMNSKGYSVSLSFTNGMTTLNLSKD